MVNLCYVLISGIITLLHQFPFFLVDSLSQFFEWISHVLLRSLTLLDDFSLARAESLILVFELIDFILDLDLQLFNCLHDNRVSLLEELHIMASVFTMDDAFRANGRNFALEAEILDFFLRVFTARFTHLSKWSGYWVRHTGLLCPSFVSLRELLRLVLVTPGNRWFHLSVRDSLNCNLVLLLDLLLFEQLVVDFKQLSSTFRIEDRSGRAELTNHSLKSNVD